LKWRDYDNQLSGKKIFPIGIGTWGFGGWLFTDKSNDRIELKHSSSRSTAA